MALASIGAFNSVRILINLNEILRLISLLILYLVNLYRLASSFQIHAKYYVLPLSVDKNES